jgi:magnesium-protoporphyrin O-methyltransferase
LETYFDRTAFDAWKALTSDAPVSKVRATVRAGRDRMRSTLLDWLPADLSGCRILDAGCGTGALAVEAARRGAEVVAVDVSAQLIAIAQERTPAIAGGGSIDFRVGDMLDSAQGEFDHIVAMDSLIHYRTADIVAVVTAMAARTRGSIVFTVTPRTLPLMLMLGMGKAFPRGDRAPAIIPADIDGLRGKLTDALPGWGAPRTHRVSGGFYTSQAVELARA